jgi:hypothetical protein
MISIVISEDLDIKCRGELVTTIHKGDEGVLMTGNLGNPIVMLTGNMVGKTLYLEEGEYEEVGEYVR